MTPSPAATSHPTVLAKSDLLIGDINNHGFFIDYGDGLVRRLYVRGSHLEINGMGSLGEPGNRAATDGVHQRRDCRLSRAVHPPRGRRLVRPGENTLDASGRSV